MTSFFFSVKSDCSIVEQLPVSVTTKMAHLCLRFEPPRGKTNNVVTAKLICVFVFAYADCWFSHEATHFKISKHHSTNDIQYKDFSKYNLLLNCHFFFTTIASSIKNYV